MVESLLTDRFEFKYLLSPQKAVLLMKYLDTLGLQKDENSRHDFYTINSLYFDTPNLDDYMDKEGSFQVRKKMRVRMYKDSWKEDLDRVWFEIKRKKDMNIYKTRVEVAGDIFRDFYHNSNVLALGDGANIPAEQKKLDEFKYLFIKQNYRPRTIVKYKRMAYLDKFLSSVRVTFDKDIVASWSDPDFFGEEDEVMVSGSNVVMEVKFNGQLPWWFVKARDIFDLKRTDYSKYVHSVESLRLRHGISIPK